MSILRKLADDSGSLESFYKNTVKNIMWLAGIAAGIYGIFNWLGLSFLGAIGT